MAEQVVNIRDRIEKMRNQINDESDSQFDHKQTKSVEDKFGMKKKVQLHSQKRDL